MNIFHKLRHRIGRHKLSCYDVNTFLAGYLEGSIDEPTRREFETHIEKCQNCRKYFDQYRATVDMVKTVEPIAIPAEIVEQTLAFLQNNWSR